MTFDRTRMAEDMTESDWEVEAKIAAMVARDDSYPSLSEFADLSELGWYVEAEAVHQATVYGKRNGYVPEPRTVVPEIITGVTGIYYDQGQEYLRLINGDPVFAMSRVRADHDGSEATLDVMIINIVARWLYRTACDAVRDIVLSDDGDSEGTV